jgi:hypothetical protein
MHQQLYQDTLLRLARGRRRKQGTVPNFVPITKPYRVLPGVQNTGSKRGKPLLDKAFVTLSRNQYRLLANC